MFLFKDDKTTIKDEIYLTIFICLCLAGGILMVVYKNHFGFLEPEWIFGMGLALIIAGVMFIPSLIYRLLNRKTDNTK